MWAYALLHATEEKMSQSLYNYEMAKMNHSMYAQQRDLQNAYSANGGSGGNFINPLYKQFASLPPATESPDKRLLLLEDTL